MDLMTNGLVTKNPLTNGLVARDLLPNVLLASDLASNDLIANDLMATLPRAIAATPCVSRQPRRIRTAREARSSRPTILRC